MPDVRARKGVSFPSLMLNMTEIERLAQKSGNWPLRPHQSKALAEVSAGRDLLLVWPTGSGKSLCYQLPSLVLPGLTVVVSPLIALMDDQVAKGRKHGWPVTCIHSGVSKAEREKRLAGVLAGRTKLLYVTPERFRQNDFTAALRTRGVSLLAVDEAHCISQWGQDFRPDYSRLGQIRESLGHPPVIALTATATREVQTDILKQLHAPAAVTLWEGVERPNLYLAAEEFDHADDKLPALIQWLAEVPGPKIVYFTLIGSLEKISSRLNVPHDVYHGDLPDNKRRQALRRFLNGESSLMLATPAFGLGVDKPDVRGVLHFETPGSLESYFQEVGRAGRDGADANCLMLYAQSDLETQMRFIETLTPDPDFVRATYELLVKWRDRLNVTSLDDLREQLSFKNKRDFRLETALSHLDRWDVIRYPQRRLDKLEFVRELTDDDLTPALWTARRTMLQKKLLALVQWFRGEGCRKVSLYAYFGREGAEPCGFCDRCREAGIARP